ncbi:TonB-dependent receptor [Neisseria perflava]|uniref:TonB-dependent receptor n=1 Tax=Neisseria perflava TaxID=33053 RepID=UPI00209D9687|nr:TonB-dependent receptor [Neisseria perflava]MCP1660387.1 iron complex outermembrane receptor protein [Neisseria perflava]
MSNDPASMFRRNLVATALICAFSVVYAADEPATEQTDLETVNVTASADASKSGLIPAFNGGQVANGARAGILGNKTNLENPFSTTAYTNKLIQDKQAKSVGDVLQNDPTVRIARGYGNFQESYFIRGFASESDDTMYNGLYGILPRQYIATELFERVEVLRGASAFMNGMAPGGNNIGGTVSVLPKRAPNEELTRFTAGYANKSSGNIAADIARRFGANQEFGVRFNAAHRNGHTSVDDEKNKLSLLSLGLDWRGEKARLSADLGWQDNKLKETRTNVTLGSAVTAVPAAPDASSNWAQPWTYSNERDVFGTLRGEYDLNDNLTAYAAYGFRKGKEQNSLANLTLTNSNGNGTQYRFDNKREDVIHTGEAGLRGHFATGALQHEWVLAANQYQSKRKNAYVMDYRNTLSTNLYNPVYYADAAYSSSALYGNASGPAVTNRLRLRSVALGDTVSAFDKRLQLTLGARWQEIHSESFAYNTGKETDYKKSRISPAVGVAYRLTPQWSVYGNYVESLMQGATAAATSGGTAVSNAYEQLSPYVSKQKEIGAKFEGGGFGAGLALFSTDKPRALYVSDGNQLRFTSEGRDRHRGIELTAYGEAARGVRVLGGLTFLDTEQRETGSSATDGKRTIGVPKFQANLGVEWEVAKVQGLAFDGRMVYTGSSYANAANTLKVGGWTRFDVGARYRTNIKGHEATFRARVDNVANKNYWASVGGYPGSGYLNAGAPRTFSLSASVEF